MGSGPSIVPSMTITTPTVDGLTDDMRQVILRLGAVDRHVAGIHISDVSQNSEIDLIKQRLDRVERRLELTDP